MRDKEYFYKEILIAKDNPQPGYGGNVLPAMEIYANIDSLDERKAYQDALEKLLQSDVEEIRKFGVVLCLGFFVFRDVIRKQED